MSINIPMTEGTPAAGGYLVPDEYAGLLIDGVLAESAALSLAGNVATTSAKTTNWSVLTDTPTAAFVGEGQAKPVSGAGFDTFQINQKKLAVIVPMSTELLEDAQTDPRVLIDAPVRRAFAQTIDAHLLGWDPTGSISSNFDSSLADTNQYVELDATGDTLRSATSAAMAKIEANGYTPNAVIWASDAKAALRNAHKAVETTDLVYAGLDPFYGLTSAYSSNLSHVGSSDVGVCGYVGDFNHLIVRIRSDISVSVSDQATLTIDSTPVNLWENNLVAVRYEMRIGAGAHDVTRAFCKVQTPGPSIGGGE